MVFAERHVAFLMWRVRLQSRAYPQDPSLLVTHVPEDLLLDVSVGSVSPDDAASVKSCNAFI